MSRFIVDTSVMAKWITQDNELNVDQADKILSRSKQGELELFAPELAKYELGNILWKKNFPKPTVLASIDNFYSLPINFVCLDENLAKETMVLSLKEGITYYDASFLSLTKEIGGTLVTDNPKHQNKKIEGIKVINLKDYK